MQSFLDENIKEPSKSIVIGNEAGDADSIISALTLAYLTGRTPVLSIPRKDLETQRPETTKLLKLAGITLPNHILDIDSDFLMRNNEIDVTLVDHNACSKPWNVIEIMDHHQDMGLHPDCPKRNVAFEGSLATTASTCTLVTERLQETRDEVDSDLATLLLGVILLDSINMSKDAAKGTDRDARAIQFLLTKTKWDTLSPKTKSKLQVTDGKLSTDAFFDVLQQSKFDIEFWTTLSTFDALRLDYKSFGDSTKFGVSTVLIPGHTFLRDDDTAGIIAFMEREAIDFLGVMFSFEDETKTFRRQLLICTRDGFPVERLVKHLTDSGLELKETLLASHETSLSLKLYDQFNVKASRKQVAPILTDFFTTYNES